MKNTELANKIRTSMSDNYIAQLGYRNEILEKVKTLCQIFPGSCDSVFAIQELYETEKTLNHIKNEITIIPNFIEELGEYIETHLDKMLYDVSYDTGETNDSFRICINNDYIIIRCLNADSEGELRITVEMQFKLKRTEVSGIPESVFRVIKTHIKPINYTR